jgi:hypothetical protein
LHAATLRLLKTADVPGPSLPPSSSAAVDRGSSGGPGKQTARTHTVFIVAWAVKRIQRAFRSYGKRRDRRVISELLGI